MKTLHITKTRGASYPLDSYEHGRHDHKPCFVVDSVVNKSHKSTDVWDLCYIIDLPLKVMRSNAWLRFGDPIDLSPYTLFGKCLLETLKVDGVMTIPHHDNKSRISVWVSGTMEESDRYCRPEVAGLVQGLPESIWLPIEYAIHRHENFGRRIGEFAKRL